MSSLQFKQLAEGASSPKDRVQRTHAAQADQLRNGDGFVAALDQSGASTPQALELYGIDRSEYSGFDGYPKMMELMHGVRERIVTSQAFDKRILAAILCEDELEREIEGKGSIDYLWGVKHVVPLLSIGQTLEAPAHGVRRMKAVANLEELLQRAKAKGIFGIKTRCVIELPNAKGIGEAVKQQFEVARKVLTAGMTPIIQLDVDADSPRKAEAEAQLRAALLAELEWQPPNRPLVLQLSLPATERNLEQLVQHPSVVRVLVSSGGLPRATAVARLSRCSRVIASFCRALLEGLSAQLSEEEFNRLLDTTIAEIHAASSA